MGTQAWGQSWPIGSVVVLCCPLLTNREEQGVTDGREQSDT